MFSIRRDRVISVHGRSLASWIAVLFLASGSMAHAQFNAQFDAGAAGFGVMAGGGGGMAYGGGLGQMSGAPARAVYDPQTLAMAQYFNWNGGTVGAGVDGRVNTPPIGWAAMDNYRQWWNAYDEVRDMNRKMQESKSAY